MKLVPCITWIKRGVCKEMPEKVRLTKEELKDLIEADSEALLDVEEPCDADVNGNHEVRGEVAEEPGNITGEDVLIQYNLDKYDEEDGPSSSASALKGLLCFSSNDGDPYMTVSDEEDESDVEDIQIKPDDNLVAVGFVDHDCNNIEFHVYNENENQFFAHHDILLPSMPLCMEWLNYEPDKNGPKHGNYLAVGGMSTAIEVWDVDVVDCLEPAFVLGSSAKTGTKNNKRVGHKDAVLDLSWNTNLRQLLASGSADHTAALWDMSNGMVITTYRHFSDKVQSLRWHPFESQYLLIGCCDQRTSLVDCRDPKVVTNVWKCDGEVEKVVWNHFNPFYCLASTDKGFVHCFDARTEAIVWTLSAHQTSCTGLSLSSQCPGLLATTSLDEKIKVWDILDNQPSFVQETKLNLGKLYSLAASPDSPFLVCAGGDHKDHNYKLINLLSYSAVQNRFKDRGLILPSVVAKVEKERKGLVSDVQDDHSVSMMDGLVISESDQPSASKSRKKKKKKKTDAL